MTKKDLEKRIGELEAEVKFLREQLEARAQITALPIGPMQPMIPAVPYQPSPTTNPTPLTYIVDSPGWLSPPTATAYSPNICGQMWS